MMVAVAITGGLGFYLVEYFDRRLTRGEIENEAIWLARYDEGEKGADLNQIISNISSKQGVKIDGSRWRRIDASRPGASPKVTYRCLQQVDGKAILIREDLSVGWEETEP